MSMLLDRPDREATAQRLLRASVQKSFDPEVDVDWEQPLVDGLFYMPEHRVSLYGTPLWERMSHAQRVDLSRHEIASTASVGIWFELILLQLLARHVYDLPATSDHVRYALVEIGDECRHSVMFSRMIEKLGCPAYGPGGQAHTLGRLLKSFATGPEVFAAFLIAEEILDACQRELMIDESVQPLVRRISKIHVIEEARHVRYAHDELVRQMAAASPAARTWARWVVARSAWTVSTHLVHPDAYAAVGLEPRDARRMALANPARRESMRWASAKLVRFFAANDLLSGPGLLLWRRSGLIT
ncbi:MAG: diiron oxygenase [Candidatus Dormibacteraeota bacterium]|nr:diiron oxygenase [Candidatus Dormibacteraeota bacterium]